MTIPLIQPHQLNASPLVGFRNKLANPIFNVNQRGTSFTGLGTGVNYTSDRWLVERDGSGATVDVAITEFPAGQAAPPVVSREWYMEYDCTVAGSGATYNRIRQKIEDAHTLHNGKATVTIWAEAAGAGTVNFSLHQNFGSGGSPSSQVNLVLQNAVSIGGSWTMYQYEVDIPSVFSKIFGTNGNSQLILNIDLPLNATYTFRLAHVSVVPGTVAPEDDPISARFLSLEHMICRRYMQKSYNLNVAPGAISSAPGLLTNRNVLGSSLAWAAKWDVYFNPPMRGTPTVTAYSHGTGNAGNLYDSVLAADVGAGIANPGQHGCVIHNAGAISTVTTSFQQVHFTAISEL